MRVWPTRSLFPAGKFEKGMKVSVARTGRTVTLAAPQRMFANERRYVGTGKHNRIHKRLVLYYTILV
jgi:hypothetical protein